VRVPARVEGQVEVQAADDRDQRGLGLVVHPEMLSRPLLAARPGASVPTTTRQRW
jgi:hypothetical protein